MELALCENDRISSLGNSIVAVFPDRVPYDVIVQIKSREISTARSHAFRVNGSAPHESALVRVKLSQRYCALADGRWTNFWSGGLLPALILFQMQCV